MTNIFETIFARIEASNSFAEYPQTLGPHINNAPEYVRKPTRPGEFATREDSVMCLAMGQDIPQPALGWNVRSTRDALALLCPADAVRTWLTDFLTDVHEKVTAHQIFDFSQKNILKLPVPTAAREEEFSHLVAENQMQWDIDKAKCVGDDKNAAYTPLNALHALHHYKDRQPEIMMGLILWQYAMTQYALAMQHAALSTTILSDVNKTSVIAFTKFLGTQAFPSANAIASLPLAFTTYAASQHDAGGTPAEILPEHIKPALADLSARGGFRTWMTVGKTDIMRFVRCAGEDFVTDAYCMPLGGAHSGAYSPHGALADYIHAARTLITRDPDAPGKPSWKHMNRVVVQAMEIALRKAEPAAVQVHEQWQAKHASACPYHQTAALNRPTHG